MQAPPTRRRAALAQVDELAAGIYRICSYLPGKTVGFNQYPIYDEVRAAVSEVLDPARLEYIVVPHFEADECGGMGRFVAEAKSAVLVCSAIGAAINLRQWDYAGPVEGAADGETVELGEH